MRCCPVQAVQNGGAGSTRRCHRRAEHVAVNQETVLPGIKQLGKASTADFAVPRQIGWTPCKDVVLGDSTAQGQLSSRSGDGFNIATQFDLCSKELVARLAIFSTFSGKTQCGGCSGHKPSFKDPRWTLTRETSVRLPLPAWQGYSTGCVTPL